MNLTREFILNFIFKVASFVINILIVKVSIKYLGNNDFGIWSIIFSFVSYFYIFDFGIGNGLRNRLVPLIEQNKYKSISEYISTTYLSISLISIIFILLFLIINNTLDWNRLLNINLKETSIVIQFVSLSFFINLVLKNINSICFAFQKSSFVNLINLTQVVITLILLNVISLYDKKFIFYALVLSFSPTITYFISSFLLFKFYFKKVKLSFRFFKSKKLKYIYDIGLKFFLIQICSVVLYSTDNLIIAHYFSPLDVTKYNIILKYYTYFSLFFNIFLSPIWSGISKAKVSKNYQWIRQIIKRFSILIIILSGIIMLLNLKINTLINLWIGKDMNYDFKIICFMTLYIISGIILQFIINVNNGLNKINLQLSLYIFCAFVNIPLSIFLSTYIQLGISGVICATFVCNLFLIVILSYFLRINENKTI